MKLHLQVDKEKIELPIWENMPFSIVANKIKEGVLICPELEKYYDNLFNERNKAFELQNFVSK